MVNMFISYCQKDEVYADNIDLYFKDKDIARMYSEGQPQIKTPPIGGVFQATYSLGLKLPAI